MECRGIDSPGLLREGRGAPLILVGEFSKHQFTPRKAWIARNGGLSTGSGAATLVRCAGTGGKPALMNESVAICSGGCQHVWDTKLVGRKRHQRCLWRHFLQVLVLTLQEEL